MQKFILVTLAAFCFLHILRDYMQVEFGYNHSWFTSFGHVWHAPQYEVAGMMVFFLAGSLALFFAFR